MISAALYVVISSLEINAERTRRLGCDRSRPLPFGVAAGIGVWRGGVLHILEDIRKSLQALDKLQARRKGKDDKSKTKVYKRK